MQVNNNVNSMMQLEKKLEQSASALSKLSSNTENTEKKNQNDLQDDNISEKENSKDVNITNEMVKQIEIPIAYTANAQVISTQDSVHQTIIDIKA